MKKTIWAITVIAIFCFDKAVAQDDQTTENKSVERSVKGIQIGENGLNFTYELRMTNQITLRTEAGYTLAFASGDKNWLTGEREKGSVAALPNFTLESRWYYNLDRRIRKGKDITRNRANYFSVFISYAGGWGAIKFDDRQDELPDFFYVAPMWGMRRTLGEHFNYELGAGIGYASVTDYKHFDHTHKGDDGITVLVRARFGFDF